MRRLLKFAIPVSVLTISACGLPDLNFPLPKLSISLAAAAYQPFEHGFMVSLTGSDCVYAYADGIIIPLEIARRPYGSYAYCVPFADLAKGTHGTPEGIFGQVWSAYPEMRAALGAPSGAAQRYVAARPSSDAVIMGGIFYAGIVTLPDGRKLYCGMRAATAGTCQLR